MKTINISLLYCDIFTVAIEDENEVRSVTCTAIELKKYKVEWLNDGYNLMFDSEEICL